MKPKSIYSLTIFFYFINAFIYSIALSSVIPLPPPRFGKLTTILSIDGGGVRGIIPAVLLTNLEMQLQKEDEKRTDAVPRIADYFDVISGTSTGGLVAAMLTAPDKHGRPLFAAERIKTFYMDKCKKIFPHKNWMKRAWRLLNGPIYKGKSLHNIIEKALTTDNDTSELSEPLLGQALTNLVIPTFDIKTLKAVIFASNEVEDKPYLNCTLKDICIGTSAAPTFLPAHYFKSPEAPDGSIREFNIIDGGVVANNPTLVAMSTIKRGILKRHPYFLGIEPKDNGRFLVLSLGTGSAKKEQKYNAKMASNWGGLVWLLHKFSSPIIDIFMQGSADLVELHLAAEFQAFNAVENYLRIQNETLIKEEASLDISTKTNLENLVKIAEKLLTQPLMRMNVKTDNYEPVPGVNNTEALISFAKKLVKERHLRIKNKDYHEGHSCGRDL